VGLYKATDKNVFVFCGFPEVMEFTDRVGSGGYAKEICNFGIYTVGENTTGQWWVWSEGSLSEKMLYVLRMWQKDEGEEELRGNVARLAAAVRLANASVEKPKRARELFSGWIQRVRDSFR